MGKQWKHWQTILGGSKITADGDCSHEIKSRLLLGRKVMTNLDSILKSRDITLPTKVHLSSIQSLSHVWLFATPWTAACQASLSNTNSQSLPKLMSTESVMPSNHLILCRPLLLFPQSFLTSGFFQMSQLFTGGGQNIGAELQHQSFQGTPKTDFL